MTELPRPSVEISRPLWLWGILLLAMTTIIYLPGLGGPFLFDDYPNLVTPLNDWLGGKIGWQEIVFGNGSGPLGRVVSMASFLANAACSGLEPYAYKLTNLVIHLLCGGLIYLLIERLLRREPRYSQNSRRIALLISALWLVHPIQASTVLYVVQRMAQLSTLFTLMALLVYVMARQRLEARQARTALILLFAGIPAISILAVLSKENGALIPALCAVIEVSFFRPPMQSPRPISIKAFFLAFLLIPGALAVIWLALHPEAILAGYADRTFTLGQRLLSEPRALIDYLSILLLPRGPSLGLYTDDFPISQGLLAPPGTLIAICVLLAILSVAMLARKLDPLLFGGILFFFSAHLMESTAFPLEIYFEHRNYLPSVGFFMAVVAIASWGVRLASARSDHAPRVPIWVVPGSILLVLVLALGTFARAGIWSSFALIATQGAAQHPDSLRAQMDYANILQKQGKADEVQRVFDHVATMEDLTARHAAAINTVTLQCMVSGTASAASVGKIHRMVGDDFRTFEMMAFGNLADFLASHECEGLTKEELANTIVRIVDASKQAKNLVQLWRSRFIAAKLLVQSGQIAHGREQLELAWNTYAADPAVGAFLAEVQLAQQDVAATRITADQIRNKLAWWDQRGATFLSSIEERISGLEKQRPLESDNSTLPVGF